MRFGGHETFVIREGWLHKGLKLLDDSPRLLIDENACDYLGVGRNMAKSIRHWLVATQLAEVDLEIKSEEKGLLKMTDFGSLVWKKDPYFTHPGTWWAVHANLVRCETHAVTWNWFFNHFNHDRFDRSLCQESLRRYLETHTRKPPQARTLTRDVACLLACYARTIPAAEEDPEDGNDCPLRGLALVSFFRTSGHYQITQSARSIPAEILGYALAGAFADGSSGKGAMDITISEAARKPGGPGRIFMLQPESLFECVSRAEAELNDNSMEVVGLAGDRAIRVQKRSPLDWLKLYYKNHKQRVSHAA